MKSKESSCSIASALGETVTLVTDDEQQFVLSAEVAKLMVTITNLLEGSLLVISFLSSSVSSSVFPVISFFPFAYRHGLR